METLHIGSSFSVLGKPRQNEHPEPYALAAPLLLTKRTIVSQQETRANTKPADWHKKENVAGGRILDRLYTIQSARGQSVPIVRTDEVGRS